MKVIILAGGPLKNTLGNRKVAMLFQVSMNL